MMKPNLEISEYVKHCVVVIALLVLSCRQIMTCIQYARNAQPPLLMAALAPLQLDQIPGPQPIQQPAVPQQPLAQQQPARPLKRGPRVKRAPLIGLIALSHNINNCLHNFF